MLHKPRGNNCAIMPNTGTGKQDMVVRTALGADCAAGVKETPLPGKRSAEGNCLEVITMVKQVKVSNFTEVKGIVSAAAKCYNAVGVHDMKGSIADAKSILGMMSLDYSHPVKIVCEDEGDLSRVINAIKQ